MAILIAVAFGLAGGLTVARFAVNKGYSQLPFFVIGFLVLFAISFLPLVLAIIIGVIFIAAMSRMPYASRSATARRR